jgi:hypothetical protein
LPLVPMSSIIRSCWCEHGPGRRSVLLHWEIPIL